MMKIAGTVLVILIALAVIAGAALLLGRFRWEQETRLLRDRLAAAREPIRPGIVSFRELENLPAPVQRFFHATLRDGQSMVSGVRLRHAGTFNMSEQAEKWRPFRSDQQVVTQRPGFDWNGRIALLPGIEVRVHDAYITGHGLLKAALIGLVPVADVPRSPGMDAGELMRFFAEAAWYPTALLPSQGVRWEAIDDRSARATLGDETLAVTLTFTFSEPGFIDTVEAEARGRMVDGATIPTRWQGRFWNYQERDGMRIPMQGEVGWLLPAGPKPYWRGRVVDVTFEFARTQTG